MMELVWWVVGMLEFRQRLESLLPRLYIFILFCSCFKPSISWFMPISVCILQVLCLLEASYAFMATYKGHVVFIETKKKKQHSDKQPLELQRLSDTHWACRYASINETCRTYDSLILTLEEVSLSSDHSKKLSKWIAVPNQVFSFHNLTSHFWSNSTYKLLTKIIGSMSKLPIIAATWVQRRAILLFTYKYKIKYRPKDSYGNTDDYLPY